MNSVLPKIDEPRHIAKLTKTVAIEICCWKLAISCLHQKLELMSMIYFVVTKRHMGKRQQAWYKRNYLLYNIRSNSPKDIENIFFEILMQNTKPIAVGKIHHPPKQTDSRGIFDENVTKKDLNKFYTYVIGDFNINLW